MNTTGDFSVVIQAGGQSSRMGQDKALMPFLGQTLIARQVDRLQALKCQILVITNRPEAYAFLNLPCVSDLFPGTGPLGGLLTALEAAQTPGVGVVACDMPFLNPRLLDRQRAILWKEGADVVVPRSQIGPEPLHAVYRRETCLPIIRAALAAGERKLIAWFPSVMVHEMTLEEITAYDPAYHSFTNVNSPDEFLAAEELARQEDL